MKKILASLLALCMLCTFLPGMALGEDAPDIPDLEPEELLQEELLFEPALEEELIPEEADPGPLPEDLPDIPADLEEVPLLQTLEEAEKFESNVSGTVYASSRKDNEAITLTGHTTLIMDVSKTLRSISGKDYSLTVQGGGTLTVRNPGADGILVGSLTCSAPLYVEAYDNGIFAQTGNITISNNLEIWAELGDGLRARSGSIYILSGTVNVTSESLAGIAAEKNMTLAGNITVSSAGYPIVCKNGAVQITGGSVNARNNGSVAGNPHGIISWGTIEILGGSVTVSAPGNALDSAHGITIKSPMYIELPQNGKVREYYAGSYKWYTIYDAYGDPAKKVQIAAASLVRGYVKRCYQEILGREGEPAGIDYWTNMLETHQAAGADIVASFCSSKEFQDKKYTPAAVLNLLYGAMMDREPDTEGYYYWLDLLGSGCSYNLAINGFAGSAEFKKICDTYGIIPGTAPLETRDLNPLVTKFVNRCYYYTLKRYAMNDPAGTNYWAGQLLSKAQTPQQMVMNFLSTQEFANRHLSNEDYVKVLYKLYMDHEYDPAGLAYWAGLLNSGTPRSTVAAAFGASQEFQAILKSYGL